MATSTFSSALWDFIVASTRAVHIVRPQLVPVESQEREIGKIISGERALYVRVYLRSQKWHTCGFDPESSHVRIRRQSSQVGIRV
jgi:hypothetical protein